MEYISHWLESIRSPELPTDVLLAEVRSGDDCGFLEIKRIEAFMRKELYMPNMMVSTIILVLMQLKRMSMFGPVINGQEEEEDS